MKVKKEIDMEIFEESDWNFSSIPETEFFGEDIKDFYKEPFLKKFVKSVFFVLWWIISLVSVLFFAIVIFLRVSDDGEVRNNEKIIQMPDTQNTETTLVHISGEGVSSQELIDISSIFSQYAYILSVQKDYEDLNNLCEDGSMFVDIEKTNREKSSYTLDKYDCTSRAYRGIASKIKLNRVNDIVYKDGLYYCYVTLTVPDNNELFEYYLRYSYEMTQFLNVHGVSMISVSQYVNQTIGYSDYPDTTAEYLFTVKQDGDKYVLTSDEVIAGICDSVFDGAVSQITQISGSSLPKENMG